VLSTSSKSVILLTWLRRLLLPKYAIDAGPANAEPSCNIGRPEPPRRKGQRGRPPLKGRRLPTLRAVLASRKTVWTTVVVSQHEPAAFLSTDLDVTPAMILGWFVSRWRVETTFQEVRTHLGVETQRQWSDLAILRTTPALLGLFSLITVWADGLARDTTTALRPNAAAWYRKQEPTFSDAIAAVRRVLWCPSNFSMSRQIGEIIEIPTSLLKRVFQTLCLAA
jgi:hypothetical protein